MDTNTSELIFELLKRMQADMSAIKCDIRDTKQEIQSIRGTMVSMQQDIHNIYGVLYQHADRLDRIERRLDLREMAEAGIPFNYQG